MNEQKCRSCGLGPPVVGFSKTRSRRGGEYLRKTCNRCLSVPKAERGKSAPAVADLPPDQRPTPPSAPPADPLKDAYARWEDRKASQAASAREKALIQENLRLKAERDEYLKIKSPTVIIYDKAKELRADAVACAILSDWHVEEEVIKTDVHGLNEYNLEIAKRRAEHCFRNLLRLADIIARDSKVTTIHLSLLGDFFSGHIHEELMSSTLLNPGDAARECAGFIISGIKYLLDNSSYTIIGDAIPGNHGRMTHKVWASDPTGTSLETFMYYMIVGHFHNEPRVQIKVADRAMVYRTFFEKCVVRMLHGYEMKYGGGVGGITIPVNKAVAQWDIGIKASLTLFGHFHQRIDGGRFMCNGSLIGYNNFAQIIKAGFEEPVQSFFSIHARNGGEKSISAPIWLDAAHALAAT